jgi:hypothetical protein
VVLLYDSPNRGFSILSEMRKQSPALKGFSPDPVLSSCIWPKGGHSPHAIGAREIKERVGAATQGAVAYEPGKVDAPLT